MPHRSAHDLPGKAFTAIAAALALGIFLVCINDVRIAGGSYGAPQETLNNDLDRLVSSYPSWIAGYDNEYLVLKNGTRFSIFDHRSNKSFEELIEQPSINDMFYVPYPRGTSPKQPPKNYDPGRVRFAPLFLAMYGDCVRGEVAAKLRSIDWLPAHGGGQVSITTANGVDRALQSVSLELDKLPVDRIRFLKHTAGTYNCRTIAGSHARSMHAYGAAIDINTAYADYWRWSANPTDPVWRNRIPIDVVRIFEKNGFIWGGYWYHFDTMHFEYRPELL